MTIHKFLVKDSNLTLGDTLVMFPGEVPDDLLCALCKNVSPDHLTDSNGHLYCQSCINTLNNDGEVECLVDGTIHRMEEMSKSHSAFQKALQLTARCPNVGCTFEAALRELLVHYPVCKPGTMTEPKKCPLCLKQMNPKLLSQHISVACEYRLLSCPYCADEFEARKLEDHLDVCDHRPATCEHCDAEFEKFMELRDNHSNVCSLKPVRCPYENLGCTFQGAQMKMKEHLDSNAHVKLLVDRVVDLTAKVEKLTQEKEGLEKQIRKLEDKQKEEAHLRLNIEATTDELTEKLTDLKGKVAAPRKEPELEARIRELENRYGLYAEPFEKLMGNISGLK